ncbi:MAG: patatin-like phospholipase family protein [Thermodesulfobacteriota bacterium]
MEQKEICIALGQGGARSLAHIGVMQILQEEEIAIKKIAGTSAGAIVGAVFAETNDAFETQERFRILLKSDAYERSGLGTLKDHTVHGVNFWEQITTRIKGMIALSIAQSKLGILRNKHFKDCLEILIHSSDFSQLQIPFSAMATDLLSGCGVEITSGDIIKSLNASSAIPGFFPPVKLGKHLLVDGAVCCPVPVEHCGINKDDVIVAVHVPSKLNSGYQPENALDVMVRAEEINMRNLDQVKTARADIQIFPDIKDVSWNEIHRLDEMVAAGRKAAKKMLPQILKFIKTKKQMGVESASFHTESMFQACRKFYIRL